MFKLNTPFRMIIAGSSGSGKSTLTCQIIENQKNLFSSPVEKVIYCAKYETSVPACIRNSELVSFHEGVPTEEMIRNDENRNILFVLDDLLETAFSSEVVSNMFTQGRNRNISTILITQNLFPQFSKARNISLNANYIVVFRNLRDGSSINHLAKQVAVGNSKAFSEFFLNNITQPFSYLFLDFSPKTPDILRFRENILSDQPFAYIKDEDLQKHSRKLEAHSETPAFIVEFPEF